MRDQEIRSALDRHWAASDANDFETEHRTYHEDAVRGYPQSGERTRGRHNIQCQRASQPSNSCAEPFWIDSNGTIQTPGSALFINSVNIEKWHSNSAECWLKWQSCLF